MEKLVHTLQRKVALQKLPIYYGCKDYAEFVLNGIKTLLVDFGYSNLYSEYVDDVEYTLLKKLTISQEEYVLVSAMIDFYQVVQQDVNNIVGYSTDSLQVTNADKPYANISNEINKLRDRQYELFRKIDAEGVEW